MPGRAQSQQRAQTARRHGLIGAFDLHEGNDTRVASCDHGLIDKDEAVKKTFGFVLTCR
jgi:hypothetical protein